MRPTTDVQRTVAPFRVVSEFEPSGDQPQAIAELAAKVNAGEKDARTVERLLGRPPETVTWR